MSNLYKYNVFLILSICILITTQSSQAKEVNGTWFYSIDNDSFSGTDDDYTSGFQIGWVSGYLDDYNEGPIPEFMGNWFNNYSTLNGEGRQRFISYSGSHRIFTPGDTETTELVEGDLPYSGSLFGTLTVGAQDSRHMDAFSFHLGIVGPSARGDEIQNEIHNLIGSDPVNGWDNQIGDEILLNVNYEYRYRVTTFDVSDEVNGDVIFQTGGAVGNLITMATVGIGARIGWGVADDFAIPPQFFGEETIGSRPYSSVNSAERFWFFALLNTSAFANAIFWDGNSSKDSASVDYDSVIGRFYLGAVWAKSNWSLSFGLARTTVPWDTPTDKNSQTYGRLGFTYSY